MKAVLIGLWTIHREALVYSGEKRPLQSECTINKILDLKMENVLLNGFENGEPGDVRCIVARLADCGASTFSVCVKDGGG